MCLEFVASEFLPELRSLRGVRGDEENNTPSRLYCQIGGVSALSPSHSPSCHVSCGVCVRARGTRLCGDLRLRLAYGVVRLACVVAWFAFWLGLC